MGPRASREGARLAACASLIAICAQTAPATADVVPEDVALQARAAFERLPPRARHSGLFMRVTLGPGGASASEEAFGSETRIGGFGWLFEASLGGAVAPNLVLHGSIFYSGVPDPNVEQDEEDLPGADALFTTSALGIGVTYYFMPTNMYVSGAFGFGVATFEDRFGVGDSDPGPALNLLIGKEWWVASEWGIGVAGRLFYMNLHNIERLEVTGLGLLFSATYN